MFESIPAAVGWALRRARAGTASLTIADEAFRATPGSVQVTSPAFSSRGSIPVRYTADGEGVSPPLVWTGVPEGAKQIVLLIEDADSPTPLPRVHAIAWGLPGCDGELAEGALKAPVLTEPWLPLGKASSLQATYLPLDPPRRHGVHHYAFQLFVLGTNIVFPSPPGRHELVAAMRGRLLAKGMLSGTYER